MFASVDTLLLWMRLAFSGVMDQLYNGSYIKTSRIVMRESLFDLRTFIVHSQLLNSNINIFTKQEKGGKNLFTF